MSEEVLVVVKIPIQTLAAEVKSRNDLAEELFDAKLEGDNVVLFFKKLSQQPVRGVVGTQATSQIVVSRPSSIVEARHQHDGAMKTAKRRKSSKRNRMRTRGWQIVAKISNSKGQTAVVYKPFVEALFGKGLTPAQQRSAVSEILRSNGNEPTEASIEYFLMNTKEYLKQANKPESGA